MTRPRPTTGWSLSVAVVLLAVVISILAFREASSAFLFVGIVLVMVALINLVRRLGRR